MTLCSDESPCWQFSSELTKSALFPQVADYFIWLIALSVICGILVAFVVMSQIILWSERKKSKEERKKLKSHEDRIEALEGGRSLVASEVEHLRADNVVGYVDYNPYPPPTQTQASRPGRSRGDLVLQKGEMVSERARALSVNDAEHRIEPRTNRLSGSNAADLHLQETLTNDPFVEEVDEGMHAKAPSLLKEKEDSHCHGGAKNAIEGRARALSQGSLHGADKDMRYATMLRSELSNVKLSKVEKRPDYGISAPTVTKRKDQRMTNGALEQLERDKRTMLAGLTADDIEAKDMPLRGQAKQSPIKLIRQLSKKNLASEVIFNDPYAK